MTLAVGVGTIAIEAGRILTAENVMLLTNHFDSEETANAITDWLRLQVNLAKASSLVLALSGGIDSAVVCALSVRAVGPESVTTAIMPIHSRAEDREDAEGVARAFGVEALHIDLSPAYDAFIAAMPKPEILGQLALANIKPRLRMTALYVLANQHNGLVVGTGNRTELSIGYFTKYGDGGVDLLPIGDMNKTMVRALARSLSVPEQIIRKAPSAGLWEGQTDESEIGLSYNVLDDALEAVSTGDSDRLDPAVRERVDSLLAGSEHKRHPAPVFRLAEMA